MELIVNSDFYVQENPLAISIALLAPSRSENS